MTSLREYFSTDWGAMTPTDWIGLSLTVLIFVALVVVYVYALRPKNRERFDDYRRIPMDDEHIEPGGPHEPHQR